MNATCKTCPFFRPSEHGATWGECRHDAPGYRPESSGTFPAIGTEDWCGQHPERQGITITVHEAQVRKEERDRLAAMAMQGWLSSWPPGTTFGNGVSLGDVATASYAIADAMLAEAAKGLS